MAENKKVKKSSGKAKMKISDPDRRRVLEEQEERREEKPYEYNKGSSAGSTPAKLTGKNIVVILAIAAICGIVGWSLYKRTGSGGGSQEAQTASEPEMSVEISDFCSIDEAEIANRGANEEFEGYYDIVFRFCEHLDGNYSYSYEIERTIENGTVKYDLELEQDEQIYETSEMELHQIEIVDALEDGTYSFEAELTGEGSGTYKAGPATLGE